MAAEQGPTSHKASCCPRAPVKASRFHADHGLPSHLSLGLSQASPTRRKLPALLTHFNPIPGSLDQTLQEVPAATRQPRGAGDSSGPPARLTALRLLTQPPQRRHREGCRPDHYRSALAGGPILPQAGRGHPCALPSTPSAVFMSLECANPGPI